MRGGSNPSISTKNKLMLIVLVGIPGSGKSTTTKKLASLLKFKYFVEPEENKWADAAKDWKTYGSFAMLMWFRSIRTPMLIKAEELSENGEHVLIDTYYDKLLHYYIDKHCMRWLLSPSDRYFPVMKEIAAIDKDVLPDADLIIFFEVEKENWLKFLKARNRIADNEEGFLKNFETQKFLFEATKKLCEERNIELITFQQGNLSIEESIKELKKILEEKLAEKKEN
jgi:adenylate kinase family enzyme